MDALWNESESYDNRQVAQQDQEDERSSSLQVHQTSVEHENLAVALQDIRNDMTQESAISHVSMLINNPQDNTQLLGELAFLLHDLTDTIGTKRQGLLGNLVTTCQLQCSNAGGTCYVE
jgi:hypothetical protein